MFQSVGTKAGRSRRPSANAANGQFLIDYKGLTSGANGITYVNGALTGNGYGLTLIGNNGIVSNSTGLFANLSATPALQFSSGGLQVFAGNGAVINSSGVCANLAATPGLQFTSGGIALKVSNGFSVDSNGLEVVANTGIVANTTGLFAIPLGNNGIVSNSTGLFVNADSSFTVNATGLHINATGALTFQDLTLNGNLSVLGTLTTINTTSVVVENNMIELAYNQSNTTSFVDSVDSGFFTTWGNTTAADTFYGGLARVHNSGIANINPLFVLFGTTTKPTSTVSYSGAASANLGFLEAYLSPYGAGSGAFVVNSSAITITANSTLSASVTCNTLSISGGTDGQIWQSATGALGGEWAMIDAGTF